MKILEALLGLLWYFLVYLPRLFFADVKPWLLHALDLFDVYILRHRFPSLCLWIYDSFAASRLLRTNIDRPGECVCWWCERCRIGRA